MEKRSHPSDPRGLIYESYRIAGITAAECRSVFLDWALGIPAGDDLKNHAAALLAIYGQDAAKHPMTGILREAMQTSQKPKRRGGKRGVGTAKA
ncbi:MAG: hypothetical protein L3J33_07665 [Rhodobacteraceae bacterium]|nr:hypothetical protein [Paracoccaceae bacterium]